MNWLIDAGVFTSAVVAAVSGIYFLFLPTGGYRGGRNPYYGITVLFDRHTWDDLHTWFGVAMIAIVAIHLAIHWQWVVAMPKRACSALAGKSCGLSKGSWLNISVDAAVALGFILAAVSGLYFLFEPAKRAFIFTSTTWDLIHTWSGVVMIAAAVIHLAIHWRWVVKVTTRMKDEVRSMKYEGGEFSSLNLPPSALNKLGG
jgi:membrane protein implicated in regulation of membrane protease activity